MSTPECYVNTNPGKELVVTASICGKRELIQMLRDAIQYT